MTDHPQQLEVTSAKESAAILKRCEDKIHHAQKLLQRGEQMNDGLRLAIGAQIKVAKPFVPLAARGMNEAKDGDGVAAWLKDKFGLEQRTANNYVRFFETFALVASSKLETVSGLGKFLPAISQGELDLEHRRDEAHDIVAAVMGDLGMMDFIDEHAEKKPKGGARKITFHCPHCSTENTGINGRHMTCVNPKCKKDLHIKADVDPEAALKRDLAPLHEAFNEVASAIVTFRELAKAFEKQHGLSAFAKMPKANITRVSKERNLLGRMIDEAKELQGKKQS